MKLTTKFIRATDETFDEEVLNCSIPVLVNFCGLMQFECNDKQSLLNEVANLPKYKDKIKLVSLNVDTSPETILRYTVALRLPMVIFVDGLVVNVISRTEDRKKKFCEAIDEVLLTKQGG